MTSWIDYCRYTITSFAKYSNEIFHELSTDVDSKSAPCTSQHLSWNNLTCQKTNSPLTNFTPNLFSYWISRNNEKTSTSQLLIPTTVFNLTLILSSSAAQGGRHGGIEQRNSSYKLAFFSFTVHIFPLILIYLVGKIMFKNFEPSFANWCDTRRTFHLGVSGEGSFAVFLVFYLTAVIHHAGALTDG